MNPAGALARPPPPVLASADEVIDRGGGGGSMRLGAWVGKGNTRHYRPQERALAERKAIAQEVEIPHYSPGVTPRDSG